MLVTIGVIAVLLAVYAATLSSVVFQRRNGYRFQATNFVRQEMDAVRSIPYDDLVNQTDGAFLGLAYTRGPWQVREEATAPSASNVMELRSAASPTLNQETGLLIVPTNYHDDFSFAASLRVLDASPTGWGAGLAFRYRDADNHYRYRLTAGGLAFDKVQHGTVTTLWSQSTPVSKGTWNDLAVTAVGATITLERNGMTVATVTDDTFASGDIALTALNGARIQADDLSVSGGEAGDWDFDDDAADTTPLDWQRFVYFDLPGGSGTTTVTDYDGLTGIKQVTVTVSWNEFGTMKTVTGTTTVAHTD